MDSWRHLPAYQLERRADIFFALFLPDVLRKCYSLTEAPILIPEFPIRSPDGASKKNLSSNADYFALLTSQDKGPARAVLIELKTDMASKRSASGRKQEKNLICTAERGLRCLVEDALSLSVVDRKKQTRQKYIHLLSELRRLDLICYDEGKLYDKAFRPHARGVYSALEEVQLASNICWEQSVLEVMYIQPKKCDKAPPIVLDFCAFATHVVEAEQGSKEIRELFARYLREWACTEAGSPSPADLHS